SDRSLPDDEVATTRPSSGRGRRGPYEAWPARAIKLGRMAVTRWKEHAMPTRPLRRLLPLAVLVAMTACGPSVPTSVTALDETPGIANLIKERLRGELVNGSVPTPPPFTFPARVRIVPYDYQS